MSLLHATRIPLFLHCHQQSGREVNCMIWHQVAYLHALYWLGTGKLLQLLCEASSIVCCQRPGTGAHKSLFCFILFPFIALGFSVIVWLFHLSLKWEPSNQWSMSGNCQRRWTETECRCLLKLQPGQEDVQIQVSFLLNAMWTILF